MSESQTRLPTVSGRMEMTHEAFQQACQVLIGEELDKALPNQALGGVLCEAVRCSRECCEIAGCSETKVKLDQLESACAELKAFISESEMPMHTSFSDADSIAWRKKREDLLGNKAGDQLLERLKESNWLLANMRTSEVGYIAGSEWQVRYEAWRRSNGL